MTDETTGQTFAVRTGSDGEALVTSPSGRMQWMGLWEFMKFVFRATLAGHKIEFKDD
jgi:hypothetical protein